MNTLHLQFTKFWHHLLTLMLFYSFFCRTPKNIICGTSGSKQHWTALNEEEKKGTISQNTFFLHSTEVRNASRIGMTRSRVNVLLNYPFNVLITLI